MCSSDLFDLSFVSDIHSAELVLSGVLKQQLDLDLYLLR